jgi:rubrerythrin
MEDTMSFNFNADNIFEMAEEIERNGSFFYKNAAEKISDAELKKLLSSLSSMEDVHEKTFKEMRKNLSEQEKKSQIFDPNDEEALYLQSLADTKVFFNKEINLASAREVLLSAFTAEKDSILFYNAMRKFVPEHIGKKWVDSIIEEEKKHIILIGNELKKLHK